MLTMYYKFESQLLKLVAPFAEQILSLFVPTVVAHAGVCCSPCQNPVFLGYTCTQCGPDCTPNNGNKWQLWRCYNPYTGITYTCACPQGGYGCGTCQRPC